MSPLYKRPGSPNWYYKISGFGKPIQKSTGTSDKIKAQEIYDTLKAQLVQEKHLEKLGIKTKENRLWKEAVIAWLSETSSKSTQHEDKSKLIWLDKYLGGLFLHEINGDVIRRIKAEKSEEASDATVNRYLSLIRSILIRARDDWEWIDRVPKIRLYKESNDRVRALTVGQAKALIEQLPEHQKMTVLFALATGLRQSNILKLKWSQVDLQNRYLYVEARDFKGRSHHGIPLNDAAFQVLMSQSGRHESRVFTYKGQPVEAANTAAWKKALKRAGITDFRWHDLRHTWATWLRKAGTPTHELQKLGGWKTLAMVERYAHIQRDDLEYAASRLNTVFNSYNLVTGQ